MFLYSRLLGHPFEFGKRDCFSLARDFYHTNYGLKVPNFARPTGHWAEPVSLFEKLFQKCGFEPGGNPTPGDVLLTCVRSTQINHAAVYLGDETLLHHLWGRQSEVSRWAGSVGLVLRHPRATLAHLTPPQMAIYKTLPAEGRGRMFR